MTVQELIAKLQQFEPSKRVIIPGYEGGYNDITTVENEPICLNVNSAWYYGPHDRPNEENSANEMAILISANKSLA